MKQKIIIELTEAEYKGIKKEILDIEKSAEENDIKLSYPVLLKRLFNKFTF